MITYGRENRKVEMRVEARILSARFYDFICELGKSITYNLFFF